MSNQHSTQTTPEVWTSEVIRFVANDDCGGVRCTYVRIDRNNIAHVAARITGDAIGAEQPLCVHVPSTYGAPNSYGDVTHTLPDHIKTHDQAVAWWVKNLSGGGR